MEVMTDMAAKHGLKCLLHEKPFAGINGGGKHCNWSMVDSNGKNLIKPGDTPHENMQFMTILAAIVRAVDKYAPCCACLWVYPVTIIAWEPTRRLRQSSPSSWVNN